MCLIDQLRGHFPHQELHAKRLGTLKPISDRVFYSAQCPLHVATFVAILSFSYCVRNGSIGTCILCSASASAILRRARTAVHTIRVAHERRTVFDRLRSTDIATSLLLSSFMRIRLCSSAQPSRGKLGPGAHSSATATIAATRRSLLVDR